MSHVESTEKSSRSSETNPLYLPDVATVIRNIGPVWNSLSAKVAAAASYVEWKRGFTALPLTASVVNRRKRVSADERPAKRLLADACIKVTTRSRRRTEAGAGKQTRCREKHQANDKAAVANTRVDSR